MKKFQVQYKRDNGVIRWNDYISVFDDASFNTITPGVKDIPVFLDGFTTPQVQYSLLETWREKVEEKLIDYCVKKKKWHILKKEHFKICKRLIQFCELMHKKDYSGLSDAQIADLLEKYVRLKPSFNAIGIYYMWYLESRLSTKEFIKRYVGITEDKDIEALITPKILASHFKEEIELLELDIKSRKAVNDHLKRYSWMPCVNTYDKPWSFDDIIRRKSSLMKQKMSIDLNKRKVLLKRQSQILKALSPEKRYTANILSDIAYIKDQRNDVRMYCNFCRLSIYKEIGKRFDFTLKDIDFLTDNEMIYLLRKKADSDKLRSVSKERQQGFVIIKDSKGYIIYEGKKAVQKREQYMKKVLQIRQEDFVKGMIATKGKVTGKVSKILCEADIYNVKEGDILIAVTTRPHYLISMKKAAAFVTDEGGITCHAAIVARELNKPCIVNTKNATKMFKDGDIVEVDADNGIVRKVK